MRSVKLSLSLTLVAALLPVLARAQSNSVFDQPYNYTDPDGPGVMTLTPLSTQSTRYSYQPMQVSLVQGSRFFSGSGVYHHFSDDAANLEPYTLLSFTLLDSRGVPYFFQGRVSPVAVDPNYWNRVTDSQAVGGSFFATFNTAQGISSTATWSGNLPSAGTYRIEVFIPRQTPPFNPPRTNAATYVVYDSGGQALTRRLTHNVNSSQWLPLTTVNLGTNYRVILYDQTGEPTGSRSVVADAIRLTPQ
jgi:hypothetical protein